MTPVSDAVIFIASDHRGFEQKRQLLEFFQKHRLKSVDLGPYSYDPEDDYPLFARKVAEAVQDEPHSCGILICGSAHGISIAANRFNGIRAIVAYSEGLAKIGREHNNANVLCLSADFSSLEQNEKIIWSFLTADFAGEERHLRRIQMLDQFDPYSILYGREEDLFPELAEAEQGLSDAELDQQLDQQLYGDDQPDQQLHGENHNGEQPDLDLKISLDEEEF